MPSRPEPRVEATFQSGPTALAQALSTLARSASLEFCTPGHRRGQAMEMLLRLSTPSSVSPATAATTTRH